MKYPVLLRELDKEEGGGWFAEYPDLPGCVADGETREEALKEAELALAEWMDAAKKLGRPIPEPHSAEKFSGKWVQRVPRSLHQRLAEQARREGVSLNTLATVLLAEGIGQRFRKPRTGRVSTRSLEK